MIYLSLYVILSVIIGLLGANRKFGFWGYFFYSLLFSPFLGIIIVLASGKRECKPTER